MLSKRSKRDWSWVTDIESASQITDDHRLRAAGLKDPDRCYYAFSLDPDVVAVKDKGCTKNRCAGQPGCLNHLGVDKLLEEKGKQVFVDDKLVPLSTRKYNEPAGLRNLGATCYANAFLQLWFYNVSFRNTVYASTPTKGSPLFHLAYIFASLQYTQRSYVEPTVLIEALRLDKGDQQDAGEFCKLFLDLISAELSKQKDIQLETIINDLFEGSKEVTIICDECGYESPRQEAFLELEIPLKDGDTLADRIQFILGDEMMRESNKYNCPRCQTKQNAVRRTTLREVPPILQFTLVRFAYDLKSGSKKKSKATIKFPRELELGGHRYNLQAIVSHFGTDNHGHFVCEVLDDDAGCWWLCDDEQVTPIDRKITTEANGKGDIGPPTKKFKAGATGELKSRDAYMLVYSRNETPVSINPPAEVMRHVQEDEDKWMEELGDHERKKLILEEEYDSMVPAKKQVAALLEGSDRLLPTAELERWFGASSVAELFGPWTINTCAHGAIGPEDTREFKLVSQAAFDLLRDYCTSGPNSIIENGNGNGSEHANGNETIKSNGHANGNGKGKGKSPSPPSSGTTRTTYPSLPELPICAECVADIHSERAVPEIVLTTAEKQAWQTEVKRDKALVKNELDRLPQVYKVAYYYLPTAFVEAWIEYVSKPMVSKPDLDANLGRCEHGLLDVDLEMDRVHYITTQGWNALLDLYNPAIPITFEFTNLTEPGKRYNKKSHSTELCEPCRTQRLSDFTETELVIALHRTVSAKGDPKASFGRSSRLYKPKEMRMDVTKFTKLLDVKVKVYNESGILPNFLSLHHNDRELDKDETVESASILAGDTIVVKEIDRIDISDDDEVEQERGFGGTALTGRIKCPDCTFENDSGARGCAMCERPFGYD